MTRSIDECAPNSESENRIGCGYAPGHHGELLQGIFYDKTGRRRRALVTVLLPDRGSHATFHPDHSSSDVITEPELVKVRAAAKLAVQAFGGHSGAVVGGRIELRSDLPKGIGMGSSTSDVTATIRAVADYYGIRPSPTVLGRLAVEAELASDSTMIEDRVVLFAHREGITLETFGRRLPKMIIVGCLADPDRDSVNTNRLRPAEYTESEVRIFEVLRAALRRAVTTGNVRLLGQVATTSALINQRYLPKPTLRLLLQLCASYEGCGVQVAHSGTVAGLIFDPARPGGLENAQRCESRIRELGLEVTTWTETQ
ncbi:hypothetical protein JK358_28600 [Nocardia sp. 2]|uniref:GHMP kinase N-terminal domain-containing protein n=1 Tax=Nocardia acididurans TaxID=2802282 RepID=A0ABS1MCK5_9NOCA|nr:hypothetical protein [Nocardia acididurans]MBL1078372.1 hypothetical protein [Nocardia acididurans]